ncbi:MAG: hypothetical protein AB7S38_10720 [Vulcanimicrobiota bacterium]
MSELEKELAERGAGERDSSGEFTLDPAKARLKLAKYQLETPHHFALNLVASAIAGGATSIDVRQDADDFELFSNCSPLEGEALRSLFSSQPSRQLHELAIAVNGALALDPLSLTVESHGHRLQAAESPRVESCPDRGGFRFHLKTAAPMLKRLYTPASQLIESNLIAERCGLAPVQELTIHGRPARLAVQLGSCRGYAIVPGRFRIGLVDCPEGRRYELPASELHSAVLSYEETGQRPPLTVILDGVSFASSEEVAPGIRTIVWTTGLDKDLSQAGLVRDQAWDSLLEWLEARSQDLLDQLPRPAAAVPTCPSCSQGRLFQDCPLETEAGPLRVKVGSHWKPVVARVCEACGYTSLRAI